MSFGGRANSIFLSGRGEAFDVEFAGASEVEDLAAGEVDEVSDAAGGGGEVEELGVLNLAGLDLADGGLDVGEGEGLGDGAGGVRDGEDVGLAVGQVVGDFVAGVVGVVAFEADLGEAGDDLAEGDFASEGEGGAFLHDGDVLWVHDCILINRLVRCIGHDG